MTPERAKELLPVIKHFAEGGEIQNRESIKCEWKEDTRPMWYLDLEYRIKPTSYNVEFTEKEIKKLHAAVLYYFISENDEDIYSKILEKIIKVKNSGTSSETKLSNDV
jgi:hypothetical protein